MEYKKYYGGKIMIFGDLHFSDVFTGKHKNYLENCCKVIHIIEEMVTENKPSIVVFLGDIVGWNETNIKSREILSMFLGFWRRLNSICDVYSVRGNHDMKGYPDFNMLVELGFIRTGGCFDYYAGKDSDIPDVRFHLVDYKSEDKVLDILEGASNVVLGHNNYTIEGVTTWYADHDGIELGSMYNFSHVDMVISGHIHEPSPELVGVQMPSGNTCNLFYCGCPTRPIKQTAYEQVWCMVFDSDGVDTEYSVLPIKLDSWNNIFYTDDTILEEQSEEILEESLRKEELQKILEEIIKYRVIGGDPLSQVDKIPNASDEAKEMAKKYLSLALNGKE